MSEGEIETPINDSFGIGRTAYFVVPRLALESMPVDWQKEFLRLVDLLPETPEYSVYRKDKEGRFQSDPWSNYRHGNIMDIQ
jgi:hypothetical protein